MRISKGKKIIMLLCLILVGTLIITERALDIKSAEILLNTSRNDFSTNSSYTGNTASACGQYYDTYEKADDRADLVFIGEVVKVNSPAELTVGETTDPYTGETIPYRHIYTVSQLRVDTIMKGNLKKGDIVEVKQESGGISSTQPLSEDAGYFKEGERRIFLLETYEDFKFYVPASPINPHQGSMLIKDGKTKKTNDFQFIADGADENSVVTAIKEKIKNKENK